MNIIFLSAKRHKSWSVQLSSGWQMLALGLPPLALAAIGFAIGAHWAKQQKPAELLALQAEVHEHRQALADLKQVSVANIDSLTAKLGSLQAHVTRLDALGDKLVDVGGLDKGEFNFMSEPAVGGPESAVEYCDGSSEEQSLNQAIGDLSEDLKSREQQLKILEQLIQEWSIDQESKLAGRPIAKGWISSFYGMRADPFTGKPQFHKGMDFAGKEGSEVLAVAAGIVTWAGDRYGYGNLVEINHGNGYVTRYGHNKDMLVNPGDTVEKGQAIAKMGNTGRSTGAHVHFEVIQNGRTINPIKFVRRSRE